MKYQLVFIGFGEAAYNIAKGLRKDGFTNMAAFDMNAESEPAGAQIRSRALETGVSLCDTLTQAYESGDFIVSLTSAAAAQPVAASILPNLIAGQIYVDMNSAGPRTKKAIDKLERRPGVRFCDVGVMGTVPEKGHKVPMFAAGDGAEEFHRIFSGYGMDITVLDAPAGGASAIKMIKSVVMKGLPQLMFESFEAAERYGVLDTLVESLGSSLNGKTVEQLADTFISRTMIHAKRRSEELHDVIETLADVQVNSAMSEATLKKLELLASQQWAEKLGPEGAKLGYKEALHKLVELS